MLSAARRRVLVGIALVASLTITALSAAEAGAAEVHGKRNSFTASWKTDPNETRPPAWPDVAVKYKPGKKVLMTATHGKGKTVTVGVVSIDPTDFWQVQFAAPDAKKLKAGKTYKAVRLVSQTKGKAGFDLIGAGRSCGTLKATFTIQQLKLGKKGWVQDFVATFKERCGDVTGKGTVVIHNGPPPPALKVKIVPTGVVISDDGWAAVTSTVTCNRKAYLSNWGSAVQQLPDGTTAGGSMDTDHFTCGAKPFKHTTFLSQFGVDPGSTKFVVGGKARVWGDFSGDDPAYYGFVDQLRGTYDKIVPVVAGKVTPPTN